MIKLKISAKKMFIWVSVLVLVDAVVLLVWTFDDPLVWRRSVTARDRYGYPLISYGGCEDVHGRSPLYIAILACMYIGLLLYGSYLCYTVRNVSTRFQESKWIAFCIVSRLQFIVLAIPILTSVQQDRNTLYIVIAGVMFLADGVLIVAMFLPKVFVHRTWVYNEKHGIKNPSFSTVQTQSDNSRKTRLSKKSTSRQSSATGAKLTSTELVAVSPISDSPVKQESSKRTSVV